MGKHFTILSLLVIVALALTFSVGAQEEDSFDEEEFKLSDEEAMALPMEARKAYVKGMIHLDHINYYDALREYISAQYKAPTDVPIRLLVGKLAYQEAEKKMSLHPRAKHIYELTDPEEKKLNEEALALYKDGLARVNVIDYTGALDAFYNAQQKAPDHQALAQIVEKLSATINNQQKDLTDAVQLLNWARDAYQQVIDLRESGNRVLRTQYNLAQNRVKQIDKLIENQPLYEANRIKVGQAVMRAYVEDIGETKEAREERAEQEKMREQRQLEQLRRAREEADTDQGAGREDMRGGMMGYPEGM
ncbi:MAG: hypothetical protein ACLFUS_17860 [Candidatus Sumerlaeia bacterium]